MAPRSRLVERRRHRHGRQAQRRRHPGAGASARDQETLGDQLLERLDHGAAREAQRRRQLARGRQRFAGPQVAAPDRVTQGLRELAAQLTGRAVERAEGGNIWRLGGAGHRFWSIEIKQNWPFIMSSQIAEYANSITGPRASRRAIPRPTGAAMYLPAHFNEARTEVLHPLIVANPFGTLVRHGAEGLDANHLPFELEAAASACCARMWHAPTQSGSRSPTATRCW